MWAMEVIESGPSNAYIRLRDLPDKYFTEFKKRLPRNIVTIEGCLCISIPQFKRMVIDYNARYSKYVIERRNIRQQSNA
jgi:hypothetical protein